MNFGAWTVSLKKSLLQIYWSSRRIIAPKLRFSQELYESLLQNYIKPDTAWLDLGCGRGVLPSWRLEQEKRLVGGCKMIVGLDYDLPSLENHRSISLKVRGSIGELPFRENSFDLVTANMVVEHLTAPEDQFLEVNRILKRGGLFIFHTPNALGYLTIMNKMTPEKFKAGLIYFLEGRKESDIFETHYKANTKKKIDKLMRATGFEVVKIKMLATDAVFALIPPLAIPELIGIRLLMTERLKPFRTNIIAISKKVA
jgi:ubiquinone/menaquinone biosynthesis C-methylase UbiE